MALAVWPCDSPTILGYCGDSQIPEVTAKVKNREPFALWPWKAQDVMSFFLFLFGPHW